MKCTAHRHWHDLEEVATCAWTHRIAIAHGSHAAPDFIRAQWPDLGWAVIKYHRGVACARWTAGGDLQMCKCDVHSESEFIQFYRRTKSMVCEMKIVSGRRTDIHQTYNDRICTILSLLPVNRLHASVTFRWACATQFSSHLNTVFSAQNRRKNLNRKICGLQFNNSNIHLTHSRQLHARNRTDSLAVPDCSMKHAVFIFFIIFCFHFSDHRNLA